MKRFGLSKIGIFFREYVILNILFVHEEEKRVFVYVKESKRERERRVIVQFFSISLFVETVTN